MIIAFNSFLLFTFALGQAVTYYGTLRISRVVGKPTPGQVSVDKKVVYVGDYPTTFEYSQTGALTKYGNEMHLGIGDSGELIMTETPHEGFHLSPTKNSKFSKKLTYNGTDVFYFCDDDSINVKGDCTDARKVTITFTVFSNE